MWLKSLFAIFIAIIIIITSSPKDVSAAAGEYPEGTVSFVGNSARSLTVKAGDKINLEVKMTKSDKLCKVYVMYYRTDGRSPKTTNDLSKALTLPVTRGQSKSYTLTGSLETTGLPNGTYRAFIYGDQDCDDSNFFGNEDNEFACDGNPTCSAYCGQKQRPASTDGAPDEPGDLYRTSSNPAYYATYGSAQCSPSNTTKASGAPQNSCGEISGGPSCDEPSFATRKGDCEIKACDISGQGLDNLTFIVGSATGGTGGSTGGNTGGTGGSTGGNTGGTGGSTGGNTGGTGGNTGGTGGPASTEVVLVATDKAGQVKSTESKIDLKSKLLNVSAGARSTVNNEFIDSALQAKIGSGVVIGGKPVVLTKAVNVLASGGLNLTNADLPVSALIPDGTTIMGTDAWDGKIKFIPVALAGSDIPAGFKVKGQAVEIGSTTSSLVFSKPVKIDFANAECAWSATNVTCDVSYKSAGQSTWVNVPKCSAEVEKDPNKLSFGKECYIPMSNKTVVVWTYHFSQFASFIVDQPISYLMALPQVCLDKADTGKLLLQFQFGVNPAYGSVIQAFTKCASRTSCNGPEQLLTDWKNVSSEQKVIDSVPIVSDIYGIRVGDMIKFRVGGTLKDGTTPANIADLEDRYWSKPVFKRVSSCENRSGGITIEELIISPQSQ